MGIDLGRPGTARGHPLGRPTPGGGDRPRRSTSALACSILDEPTAALGVAQSGIVLRYIATAAREHGIGVIFITHNPHHASLVGDHFMVLARGEVELDAPRSELSLDKLMFHMAGGAGLNTLEHELHRAPAEIAPTPMEEKL